jgi:hypothetical protein
MKKFIEKLFGFRIGRKAEGLFTVTIRKTNSVNLFDALLAARFSPKYANTIVRSAKKSNTVIVATHYERAEHLVHLLCALDKSLRFCIREA